MTAVFSLSTRIVSGVGSLQTLPGEMANLGASSVLIVTDPGLVKTGLPDEIGAVLTKAGLDVSVYSEVESDPSIRTVEAISDKARASGARALVAIGGGSSIDAAKAGAVLTTHGGRIRDYGGIGKVPGPVLPVIAVPTTAGTGSEVTVFAVISDPEHDEKFTISSPYVAPVLAVLDPASTLKLPPLVTAATGLDALTHALEAVVSTMAQPVTDAMAIAAVRMIFSSLPRAVRDGSDLPDRQAMSQAAFLAGGAFNSSYLGLAHALASPLGGHFHMAHGVANAVVLPFVMEFNAPVAFAKYAAASMGAGISHAGTHPRKAADELIAATRGLLVDVGLPVRLRDAGAREEVLPQVARDALKSVQIKFNPRKAVVSEILALLQTAY